jgi:ribosomal protein S18 acetylase RimI-like enzyme
MISIRNASAADQDFIWEMLFWAAHADEQVGATMQSIRSDPALIRYGGEFGNRSGDLGVIAVEGTGTAVGAAWVRLFEGEEVGLASFVAPDIPELAIAVRPQLVGGGIGSRLLEALIERSSPRYGGIVLTVRLGNPAVRLYERSGFRDIGRITNRVGTESIKMVLNL